MRRNEITKELIELSKRAKELGFPQDVEDGDWYIKGNERLISCKHCYTNSYNPDIPQKEDTLILSFSRCLEWLRGRGFWLRHLLESWATSDEGTWYVYFLRHSLHKDGFGEAYKSAKTHHEAIAKAVCKILSEGQEVKILEEAKEANNV